MEIPVISSLDIPKNPTTGKSYRGGNAIHLMAIGLRRGYGDPRWMTYRQAAALAWQVRKGEKGTQIEFWEVNGRDTRSEPIRTDDGEGQPTRRWVCQGSRKSTHSPRLYRFQCKADRRYSRVDRETADGVR